MAKRTVNTRTSSSEALQEEHPEDVILVLRGIHVAPEDVCGFPEEGFKLL